jgi:hypothetical protein
VSSGIFVRSVVLYVFAFALTKLSWISGAPPPSDERRREACSIRFSGPFFRSLLLPTLAFAEN